MGPNSTRSPKTVKMSLCEVILITSDQMELFITTKPKLYRVFLLAFPRARHLYPTESLPSTASPATAVMLEGNNKRDAV
jgi:hypothetical protein